MGKKQRSIKRQGLSKNQIRRDMIISHLTMRRMIGALGIALPLICVIGGLFFTDLPVQPSISAYYHTNMRDYFVGILFMVSIFLISYKGYELIDDIVATITGIAGFGIAIFPCLGPDRVTTIGIFQVMPYTAHWLHAAFAGVFFLMLALNSIFLFTRSEGDQSQRKVMRNRIYKACGLLIIFSLVISTTIFMVVPMKVISAYYILMVIETLMLFAFGVSWLVKGEALIKDSQL